MTPTIRCQGCGRTEEGTRAVVDVATGDGLPVLWQVRDGRWLCPACATAEMTRPKP